MRLLFLATPLLFFSTAFASVNGNNGEYDCQGTGLRIIGERVIYGRLEFKLCPKQGVVYFFARKECQVSERYDSYEFDEVTHRLSPVGYEGVEWQCKKLR